jgi:transposase
LQGPNAGGERATAFYTLIQIAKLNGLEPVGYLRDVLVRISSHPPQLD